MRKSAVILFMSSILLFGSQTFSQGLEVHEFIIEVEEAHGLVKVDSQYFLSAETEVRLPIRISNSGSPNCRFAISGSFTIESPDGATWTGARLNEEILWSITIIYVPSEFYYRIGYLFSDVFYEEHSVDGMLSDTLGFAGVCGHLNYGIFEGFSDIPWTLRLTPTLESAGKTICLNNGGGNNEAREGFEWAWPSLRALGVIEPCLDTDVIPDWGGPYCFQVLDYQSQCCGANNNGLTGNTDCSDDGVRNLADITRLIDALYVSQDELCCIKNGNVEGDVEGAINLADLARLIDHVYESKEPSAPCQ